MTVLNAQIVGVRPLVADDVEEVIDLVRRQEFAHEHPPDVLRRLFEPMWSGDRTDAGFVLTTDNRIVGCLIGIYSKRVIDGQAYQFCNLSTWYVEPKYRSHSVLLLSAQMALREHTLTSFTASPEVGRILKVLGFEVVSRNRLFFGPRPSLAKGVLGGCEILDTPRAIEGVIREEHRRILHDHLPYGCGHYVVRQGGKYAYVVTNRRSVKGEWFLPRWLPGGFRWRSYPVSNVLFLSDPSIVLPHWERIQWRVMRRETTVGLTVSESLLGPDPPRAVEIPRPVYAYRLRTPRHSLDALYSEHVLLPI